MNDVIIAESDMELWSYMFITPGTYSVRCRIRDENSNENIKMKDSLITVVKSESFAQYLIENTNKVI